MKTHTILGFFVILSVSIQAQLKVTNGDFSDISGLKPLNDGWHSGLPNGWAGSAGTYGIDVSKGDSKPTCNPSELGLLRQSVGTLKQSSDSSPTPTDRVCSTSIAGTSGPKAATSNQINETVTNSSKLFAISFPRNRRSLTES